MQQLKKIFPKSQYHTAFTAGSAVVKAITSLVLVRLDVIIYCSFSRTIERLNYVIHKIPLTDMGVQLTRTVSVVPSVAY